MEYLAFTGFVFALAAFAKAYSLEKKLKERGLLDEERKDG